MSKETLRTLADILLPDPLENTLESTIWISKTEIMDYLRCPYRLYLSRKLNKKATDFANSKWIQRLLLLGQEHEDEVITSMPFYQVDSLEEALNSNGLCRTYTILHNENLHIKGRPDIIVTKGKVFAPIEIKNRKTIKLTDKIELAFYWMLLSPYRKHKYHPHGYIWLNNGSTVKIDLTYKDIDDMLTLMSQTRHTIEHKPTPEYNQECKQCKLKNDCLEEMFKNESVTLLDGVSIPTCIELRKLGIETISQFSWEWLFHKDKIKAHWGTTKDSGGMHRLAKAYYHAKAYEKKQPIYLAREVNKKTCKLDSISPTLLPVETALKLIHHYPPLSKKALLFPDLHVHLNSNTYTVIDLEYYPVSASEYSPFSVFLTGIFTRIGNYTEIKQCLLEDNTPTEQTRMLNFLHSELHLESDKFWPIITYSGNSADCPALEKFFPDYMIKQQVMHNLYSRHIDIYRYIRDHVCFPTYSHGLKAVSEYLGYKYKSGIYGGGEAIVLYEEYKKTSNIAEKERIKKQLLAYNADDIRATDHVAQKLCKEFSNIWKEKEKCQ